MTRAFLVASLGLAGCGIQGGNEGSETGKCEYRTVLLSDPDEVPEGFEATPRELFSSWGFSGELGDDAVAMTLHFTPMFTELQARYGVDPERHCGPHLETAATAELALEADTGSQSQASSSATLELRWGEPVAAALFEVGDDTALASISPEFSTAPLSVPKLQIWLSGVEQERVESLWRWSARVGCTGMCAGGSQGSVEEIDWKAPLERK